MNQPTVYELITEVKQELPALRIDPSMNVDIEAEFAFQIVRKNDYMIGMAMKDKGVALQNAMRSVASIGLTLNPALAYAYLAPREKKIQLIVGYRGMVHIAQRDGGVRCLKADVVRVNDVYRPAPRPDESPFHEIPRGMAEADRGPIELVYATAKNAQGDWMTTVLTAEDIYRIRARSESFKAYEAAAKKGESKSTPWVTDEVEMWKKSVIRNAFKTWPITGIAAEQMGRAINQLDASGDGITLPENAEGGSAPSVRLQLQKAINEIYACENMDQLRKVRERWLDAATEARDRDGWREINRQSRTKKSMLEKGDVSDVEARMQ